MKINKIINQMVYDGLLEKFAEETQIEILDKKQLAGDGVDISKIYVDDFITLKKLQYNDVGYSMKHLEPDQVRTLLDNIDADIDNAISYIKYNYIYRRGVRE